MTPREETARRFAEAMGACPACFSGPSTGHFSAPGTKDLGFRLPPADAPMPEQGAFVFRVAEAVGAKTVNVGWTPGMAYVTLDMKVSPPCEDLCHAAMLAGIAAKEGSK